ncbi:MAG: O-antigen ligase family protein [Acidobacteriota bacterium]|nr:O-antigen ligase family protein [Acidobacteriota bacterium]
MIEVAPRDSRRGLWIAGLAGLYAAAVALVPDLTVKAILVLPFGLALIACWTLAGRARWIALFFCTALLLPPLPIALGDSGPHVALLFAAIGLVAGLARAGEWRLRLDSVSLAALLLFAALLASIPAALLYSGPEIAAASLARVLLFGAALYVFYYTACGPGRFAPREPLRAARGLFWIALASALIACVDFYYQLPAPAGYGPQFVWLETGVFRRAQGMFYEASTLGNFCAFFLVMVAVALFRPAWQRPLRRSILLGGGAVFSAALIFSYSRGSLVSLVVALCALAALNRRRVRLTRLFTVLLLSMAVGAAAAWILFPEFTRLYWTRIAVSGEYAFAATNAVLSGRLDTWRTLAAFLMEHPWHALFGVGYKTLPYSDFIGKTAVADNMYLSLLVETGMLGLAALLFFHAAVLRACWRSAHSATQSPFFGAWMFCFWAGETVQMLSGDLLTYWRVLPVYFWVLALAVRDEDPLSRSVR